VSTSTDLLDKVAPELESVDSDIKDLFIETATTAHTATPWGNIYLFAMVNYAAHLMTLSGYGSSDPAAASGAAAGNAGAATSKKEGDLALGFASASSVASTVEQAWLMETKYGRTYLALRKTRAVAAPGLIYILEGSTPSTFVTSETT